MIGGRIGKAVHLEHAKDGQEARGPWSSCGIELVESGQVDRNGHDVGDQAEKAGEFGQGR